MGFNSGFKGLIVHLHTSSCKVPVFVVRL